MSKFFRLFGLETVNSLSGLWISRCVYVLCVVLVALLLMRSLRGRRWLVWTSSVLWIGVCLMAYPEHALYNLVTGYRWQREPERVRYLYTIIPRWLVGGLIILWLFYFIGGVIYRHRGASNTTTQGPPPEDAAPPGPRGFPVITQEPPLAPRPGITISNWARRSWHAITLLGILNFVVFVAIDLVLGGDALNGKVEAGHYYLSQNGNFTEVSPATYTYSRAHAISALVTLPLAIASGGLMVHYERRSKKRLANATT